MIIRLGNIYRHMSCTNYIIITCSRVHRYPVYAAQIHIAAVDYEMQKDMPFKCDAARKKGVTVVYTIVSMPLSTFCHRCSYFPERTSVIVKERLSVRKIHNLSHRFSPMHAVHRFRIT